MRNVSDKSGGENQNTHSVLLTFFFKYRAVYETTWKNIVERSRSQMTIWRTRIACWIPKATNTHSQVCVIFIAFPMQQWLHERASVLPYTQISCPVQKFL